MQKLTILNTREIKKIKELLQKQFGFSQLEDYAYLQNQKDRIFLINKDISKIELQKLIIDKIGLYFGEMKPNQIRLSKEGAQLLAQEAKAQKKKLNNVVELSAEEIKSYFLGKDLNRDVGPKNRLVLLQYQNDVLGCASYKEGIILNFHPKNNRGETIL